MGSYGQRGWFSRLTSEDRAAVEGAIDRLQVRDLVNRQLVELSGGQRQRASSPRASPSALRCSSSTSPSRVSTW
jgi:manganese/zinc/iron transport system ATP- binding protein